MKKQYLILLLSAVGFTALFTGCGKNTDKNVSEAVAGNVSEAQGTEDEYGWIPQMRLTFDGNTITEVYFDYINGETNKKSEDSTYIDNMKDKTGVGVDEAMKKLSEQLLATQDPNQVDVVTGATQTSDEFMALAKQAYDNYIKGNNINNNTTVDTSETGLNQDNNPNTGNPNDGNPNNDNTNPEDGGNDKSQDSGSEGAQSGDSGKKAAPSM